MSGYKINKLSLKQYFESRRDEITAMENWQHRTDDIIFAVHSIASHVPFSSLRKAFVKQKKTWMGIDETTYAKLFEQE